MLKGIHPKSLEQVSKGTPQKWGAYEVPPVIPDAWDE